MSPRQAATVLGVSRLTILKWIRSGHLNADRIQTQHGPGYDIRAQDLKSVLPKPRGRRGVAVLAAEQFDAARKANEQLMTELRELRAEVKRVEQTLLDAFAHLTNQFKVSQNRPPTHEEPR